MTFHSAMTHPSRGHATQSAAGPTCSNCTAYRPAPGSLQSSYRPYATPLPPRQQAGPRPRTQTRSSRLQAPTLHLRMPRRTIRRVQRPVSARNRTEPPPLVRRMELLAAALTRKRVTVLRQRRPHPPTRPTPGHTFRKRPGTLPQKRPAISARHRRATGHKGYTSLPKIPGRNILEDGAVSLGVPFSKKRAGFSRTLFLVRSPCIRCNAPGAPQRIPAAMRRG